ncbi:Uncharacterised protein [Metamycoplasma alkalescens]|nr:Uncharacterised protein [Metamycoplasma alkalescens]
MFKTLADRFQLNFKTIETDELSEEDVFKQVIKIIDEEEKLCQMRQLIQE